MTDPLRPLNGSVPVPALRPLRRGATGSTFDASLPDVPDMVAPETAGSAEVGAVNPMLLHELAVDGEEKRDREAHRHGTEILDLLAELQRGLLGTGIDASVAARLTSLVDDAPDAANPALAAALKAVLLRARVEIARHTRLRPAQD